MKHQLAEKPVYLESPLWLVAFLLSIHIQPSWIALYLGKKQSLIQRDIKKIHAAMKKNGMESANNQCHGIGYRRIATCIKNGTLREKGMGDDFDQDDFAMLLKEGLTTTKRELLTHLQSGKRYEQFCGEFRVDERTIHLAVGCLRKSWQAQSNQHLVGQAVARGLIPRRPQP